MRKTDLVQDYFICKSNLIALGVSSRMELEQLIIDNKKEPTQERAEEMARLNGEIKLLRECLSYVINNDREQTKILMELSKAKVQILELRKELDKK